MSERKRGSVSSTDPVIEGVNDSEPIDLGSAGKIHVYWQVIGMFDAIKWAEFRLDETSSKIFGPESLVMYRHVDVGAIRGLALSKMQPHQKGYPELHQHDAPTEDQVRRAWIDSQDDRTDGESLDPQLKSFAHRARGESTSDFYQRVATFYRTAAPATGRPIKALGDAADIPKTTAARWVREARLRGYLEPTLRGRVKNDEAK
jgi:hypothetical protein